MQKKLELTGSSVKELGPTTTNIFIWRFFMSFHPRQNYIDNMEVFSNVYVERIKYFFSTVHRLFIEIAEEILNVRVIDSSDPSCAKTNIYHRTGNRVDKSKSPRILRVGLLSGKNACPCKGRTKMERSIDRFSVNSFQSRILRSRRITIEFEWNIVPGLASLEMLRKIQDDSQRRNIDRENFGDRIIFMSTFNDIEWNKRGNEEERVSNSEKVKEYVKRFSQGHWAFQVEFRSSTNVTTTRGDRTSNLFLVSVLWVVEFWKEGKTKMPSISQRKPET